jgi:hypothetical protein
MLTARAKKRSSEAFSNECNLAMGMLSVEMKKLDPKLCARFDLKNACSSGRRAELMLSKRATDTWLITKPEGKKYRIPLKGCCCSRGQSEREENYEKSKAAPDECSGMRRKCW